MRGIGVRTSINEAFDMDSIGEGYAKVISDSTQVESIERHEALLAELAKATNVVKLTGTDLFTELSTEAFKIMSLADDFKYMTNKENMLIIMHPMVATMVAKEIGSVFNQEAPIYRTGLKSQFSINGIPVLIDPTLNTLDGATGDGTDRFGAIVMDIEALAFKADEFSKPVSIDLGLTKFSGQYFYSVEKLIDNSRVTVMTFDAKAAGAVAKTKKVSE